MGAPVRYTRLLPHETGPPPRYAGWMKQHDAWTVAYAPDSPLWAWMFSHMYGDWTIDLQPVDLTQQQQEDEQLRKNMRDPDHFRSGKDEDGLEADGDLTDPNFEHITNSLN